MPGDEFADLDQGATEVHRRDGPTPVASAGFVVRVVEGRDAGLSLEIDEAQPSPALVGQSPACALRLSDPRVSRRHAALEVVGDALRVTDLGSTNGVTCAGITIREALLRGGEELRLGPVALRVTRRPRAEPPRPAERDHLGRILGASLAMRRLYPLVERLAASDVPLVIEGETGTGKEALAESIHELGRRADRPFVVFDCTATPPDLVESDLFGHERGAFTGAVAPRKGVFELADGGTLFIDEIGDLDLALQPKLLRALERSEVHRVGSDRWIKVDVRVIAATRRDLDREVQAGRFRDDLFHRLAVARVELPPLRRRTGDVELLARHFWRQLGGHPDALPAEVVVRWQDASWPGNVRELRNAVARRLALGDIDDETRRTAIDEALAPAGSHHDAIQRLLALGLPYPRARDELVAEFDRRFVEHLLAAHGDDAAAAAAAAGIGLRYFQKLRARSRTG